MRMRSSSLMKTDRFVALGIGIHNFPEGMAAFAGALEDPSLGVAIGHQRRLLDMLVMALSLWLLQ